MFNRSDHPVCPNDRQEIEEEGGVSVRLINTYVLFATDRVIVIS